jgi:hypothetical protein
MKLRVQVKSIYNCSLERAYKTAILSDVSKVHTGYSIMPKVTHCTEDDNWGQPGSIKKVHVAASLTQKGGWASIDKILERVDNKYWKIEVSDFKSWILGFYKFEGIWETVELEKDRIQINYTYILFSKGILLYPFQLLFAKMFWKRYMTRVLENIRQLILNEEPYLFD